MISSDSGQVTDDTTDSEVVELDEVVTPAEPFSVTYNISLVSDHLVWEMLGELVSFPDMVWYDKVNKTWHEFAPGSTFTLYPDGHVENN